MEFNAFIWNLYLESEQGREAIESAKPLKEVPNLDEFLVPFPQEGIETMPAGHQSSFAFQNKIQSLVPLLPRPSRSDTNAPACAISLPEAFASPPAPSLPLLPNKKTFAASHLLSLHPKPF